MRRRRGVRLEQRDRAVGGRLELPVVDRGDEVDLVVRAQPEHLDRVRLRLHVRPEVGGVLVRGRVRVRVFRVRVRVRP